MPKICIMSDLHLEGSAFTYENHGEDTLLLVGDIHTRNRLHEFLKQIPLDVRVFYVAGNHCYYHGVFELCNQYFKQLEDQFPNYTFLNNTSDRIDGIPIYGGTMFTDFMLYGPGEAWFCEHRAKDGINDFGVMKKLGNHYEPVNWTTTDHKLQHDHFVQGLKVFLRNTEGAPFRIVMSHFMPSDQCTPARFKGNTLNPYFTANMEPYMGWDGIWACGHGHDPAEFDVDGTKIIMNPRGYFSRHGAENPRFNPSLVIEV